MIDVTDIGLFAYYLVKKVKSLAHGSQVVCCNSFSFVN